MLRSVRSALNALLIAMESLFCTIHLKCKYGLNFFSPIPGPPEIVQLKEWHRLSTPWYLTFLVWCSNHLLPNVFCSNSKCIRDLSQCCNHYPTISPSMCSSPPPPFSSHHHHHQHHHRMHLSENYFCRWNVHWNQSKIVFIFCSSSVSASSSSK